MPMNKAKKRDYMRAYMARAYLYAQERPKLAPYCDKEGCIRVRMTTSLRLRFLNLSKGEVYTLDWKTAAQLLAGRFAELVKDEPAPQRPQQAPVQAVAETLRALTRAAGALERSVRKGKVDGS